MKPAKIFNATVIGLRSVAYPKALYGPICADGGQPPRGSPRGDVLPFQTVFPRRAGGASLEHVAEVATEAPFGKPA